MTNAVILTAAETYLQTLDLGNSFRAMYEGITTQFLAKGKALSSKQAQQLIRAFKYQLRSQEHKHDWPMYRAALEELEALDAPAPSYMPRYQAPAAQPNYEDRIASLETQVKLMQAIINQLIASKAAV